MNYETEFYIFETKLKRPIQQFKYIFHWETNFMLSLNGSYWQFTLADKGEIEYAEYFSVM